MTSESTPTAHPIAASLGPITDPAERARFLDDLCDELTGFTREDPSFGNGTAVQPFNSDVRDQGFDIPRSALTMIGRQRLKHFRSLIEQALQEGIPGDVVETGVWRGGASIMARAVLATAGDAERTVWVCDSFEGLPAPDAATYPADEGMDFQAIEELAVGLDAVRANFARHGVLDDRVRFVAGWFRDTMPTIAVERIAVLRLDGDMYESTIDPLIHLYDRVVPGGWVVVDDYNLLPCCRSAVDDFARDRALEFDIQPIDRIGVFWRKP